MEDFLSGRTPKKYLGDFFQKSLGKIRTNSSELCFPFRGFYETIVEEISISQCFLKQISYTESSNAILSYPFPQGNQRWLIFHEFIVRYVTTSSKLCFSSEELILSRSLSLERTTNDRWVSSKLRSVVVRCSTTRTMTFAQVPLGAFPLLSSYQAVEEDGWILFSMNHLRSAATALAAPR